MDYTHWLLIFSTWLIIFSFAPASSSEDRTGELIVEICRQTPDYGFCIDVFDQHPHAQTSPLGLTQIALDELKENSTNTRTFIQKKEAAEKNREIRYLYAICNSDYGAVKKNLENAWKEFLSSRYKVMLTFLSKSERPVNHCQNIFCGNIGIGLKKRTRQVKLLISIAISAGNLTDLI